VRTGSEPDVNANWDLFAAIVAVLADRLAAKITADRAGGRRADARKESGQ
jgi:hypothetical protein